MDHRNSSNDGTINSSSEYFCTKEEFIEIVLIIADACCAVNQPQQCNYTALCNNLADHLSGILEISMQPYTCFEDFRNSNNKPSFMLTRKFIEKVKLLQEQPILMESIGRIIEHQRFSTIVIHIERKREIERIAGILLPYIISPNS